MANDNTLGAPTEGLGQTVTFAARGGGGQSQAQGSQRQSIRNNATGGGAVLTARALQVPPVQNNGPMAALLHLGGELLKPRLEQERTAAYVQGMQKAAQGQAITEIVDEQPWYSQLFGSTSLVDGARAYTANAKANSVAAGMEADMENLRKMSAEEFGSYAAQAITKNQTGDPTTDMMLTQQISATLPAVMKGQAKAHLRYQQEVFEGKIKSAQTAAFARLGIVDAASRKPGSTKEPDDVLGDFIGAIEVLEVPADMKPELHDKILATSAGQAIGDGNFAAYTLLKDSGKLAGMDQAAAYQIERSYRAAQQQAVINLPLEFAETISSFTRLSTDPATKRDDIIKRAKAINAEYTRLTGDNAPYVPATGVARELDQWLATQDAARKAAEQEYRTATTDAAKKQAKLDVIGTTAASLAQGQWVGDATASVRRESWAHLEQTLGSDSPKLARLRVTQEGMSTKDEVFADKLQGAVLQGLAGNSAQFHEAYTKFYLPLVKYGSQESANVYAGKGAKAMAEYHRLLGGREVAEVADIERNFSTVVLKMNSSDDSTSGKRATAFAKEYKSGIFGKAFNSLSSETYTLRDPEGLANITAPYGGVVKDPTEDAKYAKQKAIDEGRLEVIGGWHWAKSPERQGQSNVRASIIKGLKITAQEADKAFATGLELSVSKQGVEDIGSLMQVSDRNGSPQFAVMGTRADGSFDTILISVEDIKKEWSKAKAAKQREFSGGAVDLLVSPEEVMGKF